MNRDLRTEVAGRENERAVDWVNDGAQSIRTRMAQHAENLVPVQLDFRSVHRISERLSALLLERLPSDIALQLMRLLPDGQGSTLRTLDSSARKGSETSIGYTDFIERAGHALGRDRPDLELRAIVDAYLWGVIQGIPAELKARLHEVLPAELKSRMDLYSDRQSDAKVA